MLNPIVLPYLRNIAPLGTEDTAAPIKKQPTVKADIEDDAPRSFAVSGPTDVKSVDVVNVNAQAMARKKIFQ
jgi:hypothetical protein